MTVHNWLGITSGSRGIDNPKRMLKGNLCGLVTHGILRDRTPSDMVVRQGADDGKRDERSYAWQVCIDLSQYFAAINLRACVHISVLRNQYFRFDLLEAIKDCHMSHIWRAK